MDTLSHVTHNLVAPSPHEEDSIVAEEKNAPRRVVEFVDSVYQPTKAELEEEHDLSHLAGAWAEDLARMVLTPVEVRQIPRPRREG